MNFDQLPADCVSHILSFTSPRDAGRSSLLSITTRDASDSNLLWNKFLPDDYMNIVSRLVSSVNFRSKKELFFILSKPLLIDGGKKTFSIEKFTSKKCYMISARELYIPWSTNSLYWCWKPFLQSRFPEVVELVMVCQLEIHGKINTNMLSRNTTYGAYIIIKFQERAFGLDKYTSKVYVEVGEHKSNGTVCLNQNNKAKENVVGRVCQKSSRTRSKQKTGERSIEERSDGWFEIELGEFYNDGDDKEVKMSLKEVQGTHLKGGIVLEGIEIRPKM